MKKILNKENFPLKVFSSSENIIVISYSGVFYEDAFTIRDINLCIEKNEFYKQIKNLNDTNFCTFVQEDITVSINYENGLCDVIISTPKKTQKIKEVNKVFSNWIKNIDSREHNRHNIFIPISATNDNIVSYGSVIDISEGGFKIILDEHISVKEKIYISIFDKDFPVSNCYCEFRHMSVNDYNNKLTCGLKILNCPEDSMRNILKIINREKNYKQK